MKFPPKDLNLDACHTPQALILVEGFVNYQMTNTLLNLKKDQSTPQNIEKEQKHPDT